MIQIHTKHGIEEITEEEFKSRGLVKDSGKDCIEDRVKKIEDKLKL